LDDRQLLATGMVQRVVLPDDLAGRGLSPRRCDDDGIPVDRLRAEHTALDPQVDEPDLLRVAGDPLGDQLGALRAQR